MVKLEYIPEKIYLREFPPAGVCGITNRQALDLAAAGELPAYYHVTESFELLAGDNINCGYGRFSHAFVQIPTGMVGILTSAESCTFTKTTPMQAVGFLVTDFILNNLARDSDRAHFQRQEFYWLDFFKGKPVTLHLDRVIFMRQDLEWLGSSATEQKPEPLPARQGEKGIQQRRLIIQALESLGYDPKKLPRNPAGKAGPKKEVREKLDGRELFKARTSFDTVWKDLRTEGKIKTAD
ncbi:MAG: hypothetical protein GXZ05_00195 [Gammaproteobacteria bacterium]|nr:hypothetical protein [Gammaproteobacteria bacterium]